ncbi:MAG: hypothetical protein QM724_09805 [Flavobacteriales bacterium]
MFKRRFLLPWSLSALVMLALSNLWHGLILNDLADLKVPIGLYLGLSLLVYVLIALGLTVAVQQALHHEWISLQRGFPWMGFLAGTIVGFTVYLVAFIFGMSFTSHKLVHVVVDVLWQMVEQGVGGMAVTWGILWDLHKGFMEAERAK